MLSSILILGLSWAGSGALDRTEKPALVRAPEAEPLSVHALLDAIRLVESDGHPDGGRGATGDGGRAIGPFQIHRAYFLDARLAGRYEDCRDPDYARRVVLAYWRRWCPEALERRDFEVLARVHNGGPNGARKADTLRYWRKVEQRLQTDSRSYPRTSQGRISSASVAWQGATTTAYPGRYAEEEQFEPGGGGRRKPPLRD